MLFYDNCGEQTVAVFGTKDRPSGSIFSDFNLGRSQVRIARNDGSLQACFQSTSALGRSMALVGIQIL